MRLLQRFTGQLRSPLRSCSSFGIIDLGKVAAADLRPSRFVSDVMHRSNVLLKPTYGA